MLSAKRIPVELEANPIPLRGGVLERCAETEPNLQLVDKVYESLVPFSELRSEWLDQDIITCREGMNKYKRLHVESSRTDKNAWTFLCESRNVQAGEGKPGKATTQTKGKKTYK